jgi:hypothetical protein
MSKTTQSQFAGNYLTTAKLGESLPQIGSYCYKFLFVLPESAQSDAIIASNWIVMYSLLHHLLDKICINIALNKSWMLQNSLVEINRRWYARNGILP